MIKLKPLLSVVVALAVLATIFYLGILFPTVMFLLYIGIAITALIVTVYKVAEAYFAQEDSEEEGIR